MQHISLTLCEFCLWFHQIRILLFQLPLVQVHLQCIFHPFVIIPATFLSTIAPLFLTRCCWFLHSVSHLGSPVLMVRYMYHNYSYFRIYFRPFLFIFFNLLNFCDFPLFSYPPCDWPNPLPAWHLHVPCLFSDGWSSLIKILNYVLAPSTSQTYEYLHLTLSKHLDMPSLASSLPQSPIASSLESPCLRVLTRYTHRDEDTNGSPFWRWKTSKRLLWAVPSWNK